MSKLLFFSGAGLSADSGLSTFRDAGGLWDKYDIDKVCNALTWKDNYELVHEFYSKRRVEYKNAKPNAMHLMIAELQKKYGKDRVQIITQNVDMLLEKAGCEAVLHVHGRIDYIHCTHCKKELFIDDEFRFDIECECGCKKFKPSIVFFNEAAPMYRPMYKSFFEDLKSDDTAVVIGTSGFVVPIDFILGPKCSGCKATRILCNLEKSEYIDENNYDFVFYEKAADAAEKIRGICEERMVS
jgi:NAD-dependent deacetylase